MKPGDWVIVSIPKDSIGFISRVDRDYRDPDVNQYIVAVMNTKTKFLYPTAWYYASDLQVFIPDNQTVIDYITSAIQKLENEGL